MGDLSLSAVRAEFPLLETCTYLNSNSTGAFPRGMDAVLQRYGQTLMRWRDEAWEQWWAEWLGYMDAIASFINAPPGSVVTDTNLTTLLGRLATCFDFKGERHRIVLTDLEFPTVPFMWRGFGRYGAETVVVPTENGRVDEERLCAAIDERTLLVSISHANFSTGAMVDLAQVVSPGAPVGAKVVADAYQSVGVVPLDVKRAGRGLPAGWGAQVDVWLHRERLPLRAAGPAAHAAAGGHRVDRRREPARLRARQGVGEHRSAHGQRYAGGAALAAVAGGVGHPGLGGHAHHPRPLAAADAGG